MTPQQKRFVTVNVEKLTLQQAVRVPVLREDIRKGVREDGKTCAISRALCRAFGGTGASTGLENATVTVGNKTIGLKPRTTSTGKNPVGSFIAKFDEKKSSVSPRTFTFMVNEINDFSTTTSYV